MLYWSKENLQEQIKAKEERLKQLHYVGFNEFLAHIDEWWRLLNEALNMRVDGFGATSGGYSRGNSGGWNIRFNRVRRIGGANLSALNSLKLPKFSVGGGVGKSVSEIANLSGKEQTSCDVNIRLNFGDGKEASVMSDAQTARNLERYLKSLGV